MRCVILVIDGLGIGELPEYKTKNANSEPINIKSLRNLAKYGLSYLINANVDEYIESAFGRMALKSNSASLRTSLWELFGVQTIEALDPIFELNESDLKEAENKTGLKFSLKNNDSNKIFIHANENNNLFISYESLLSKVELEKICDFFSKNFNVDKIIFSSNKSDIGDQVIYNKELPKPNVFSDLINFGYLTKVIGNVDIYLNDSDISEKYIVKGDEKVFEKLINIMDDKFDGVIFSLFDDYYNKIDKRKFVLKRFDSYLPVILDSMKDDDILFITSTTGVKESSHMRIKEFIPIIIKGKLIKEDSYIGVRHSASDMAQTIVDIFGINKLNYGKSFKKLIMEG